MSETKELLMFSPGSQTIATITGAAGSELILSPARQMQRAAIRDDLADLEIVGANRFRRIIAGGYPYPDRL